MDVKDFRVGNFVTHDDYTAGIFVISEIEKDGTVNTIGGKNGTWLNHYSLLKDVQLTFDWLVRFGFKYIRCFEELGNYYEEWTKDGKILSVYDDSFCFFNEEDFCMEFYSIREFQNIWEDMTKRKLFIEND